MQYLHILSLCDQSELLLLMLLYLLFVYFLHDEQL